MQTPPKDSEAHWGWALSTRELPCEPEAPTLYTQALAACAKAPDLLGRRDAAIRRWSRRKTELDAAWAQQYARLPQHVRKVVGPGRNLLLLQEMLEESRTPDPSIPSDVAADFP